MVKNTGSARLSAKILCMESVQTSGKKTYRRYDVHSLAAIKALNQRSLIISRSTYPSSGRYVGHWLGDNKSIWDDLYRSIIGMLEFNTFGIPYIGADVCGFEGNATNELCTCWMQLGAFYPFFRNHNALKNKDQDPVALGEDVTAASRRDVRRRYALNPYLYTLFYRAHISGSTGLIFPVPLQKSKDLGISYSRQEKKIGDYIEINDIFDNIPLHVRGECIIPTKDNKQKKPNPEK
ncbi:lysosomal alpha-glucosidase-like [Argiope bruennichi]|uniref:lysosomal alpha-glucosidase-like n=1 Tax=Argiope bruennichi TaxID=94029 RepID=UPI0024945B42|nr:lysosomal alpha-glucosidase-like [Argiope bruennichi]